MDARKVTLACVLAGCAQQGLAATATDDFVVSATVTSSCTLVAADLAFGAYDPGAATPDTASSNITVTCTLLLPYNVGLSGGTTNNNVSDREMSGAGCTVGTTCVNYQLQRAGGLNWGNTVGTDTVSGVGSGLAQTLQVNGQIPAGQNVAGGDYQDTVTATVTY